MWPNKCALTVHPQIKIRWKCPHSQVIQDIDELVSSSDLEKCSVTSLAQQLILWITCGLLWCFYQLFRLSFWRHPFTAEHPLLSKWCNDTFLQIWWRNKRIHVLDDLRVRTFSAHFWVNCFFIRVIFSIIKRLQIKYLAKHTLLFSFVLYIMCCRLNLSSSSSSRTSRRLTLHPGARTNHCIEINTVLNDVTSFKLRKTSIKSVLISTSKAMRAGSQLHHTTTANDG